MTSSTAVPAAPAPSSVAAAPVPATASTTTGWSDSRQITARAPESASWWRTSAGFDIGLIAVATQPACQAAWIAITVAGPFCSISASRSPGPQAQLAQRSRQGPGPLGRVAEAHRRVEVEDARLVRARRDRPFEELVPVHPRGPA